MIESKINEILTRCKDFFGDECYFHIVLEVLSISYKDKNEFNGEKSIEKFLEDFGKIYNYTILYARKDNYKCNNNENEKEMINYINLKDIERKNTDIDNITNTVKKIQEQLPIDLVTKLEQFTYIVYVKNNDILKEGDIVLHQTGGEVNYYKLSIISTDFDKKKKYFKFIDETSLYDIDDYDKFISMQATDRDCSIENQDDIILVRGDFKKEDRNKHKFPYKDDNGVYDKIIIEKNNNSIVVKYYKNENENIVIKISENESIDVSKRTFRNFYYKFIRKNNFDSSIYRIVSNITLSNLF